MTPGPLWRRAVTRAGRERAWALLVAAAFLLTAAAGAADVLSVSAWRSASVQRVLDAVPEGAVPRVAPVLRVAGAPDPGPPLDALRERVDAVPGLGPGGLTGVSFADELLGSRLVRYDGWVQVGGVRLPARPVAVDDPASVLVVTGGGEDADGLWLPTATAEELGVGPGDDLRVGITVSRGDTGRTTVRVAGTYEVGPDGTTPADRPTSTFWLDRAGRLPGDPGGRPSIALLVGQPDLVVDVAADTGDFLLWTIDARLDPALPTRTGLGATVRGVEALQRELGRSGLTDTSETVLTTAVSGLPGLAGAADDITRRAAAEARTPALGSIVLGLALVLAVSALTAARRERELELLAGLGVRPPAAGLLGLVEVLPTALLGWLLGVPAALLAVRLLTGVPPEPGALALAAGQAAVLVAAAVLLHAVVQLTAAAAASRRGARHHRPQRSLPWRPALVVAAVAAAVGLLAAPVGEARGLDLAVPVLVAAAVGAVGAGVLRRLAAGRLGSRDGARAPGRDESRSRRRHAGPGALGPRRVGVLVVRRRLAGGGAERLLVVTALATAFGLAAHVVAGQVLVDRAVEDKVAVLAGAPVVVELDYAYQVDPDLPTEGYPRDVAVADGDSVVFRASGRLPGQREVDVLVVDPGTLDDVAAWGHPGGPLGTGRRALDDLAVADAAATPVCPSAPLGWTTVPPPEEPPDPPPPSCPPRPPDEDGLPAGRVATGAAPVLLVGEPAGLRVGSRTTLDAPNGDVLLQVVGRAEAFPGLDPDLRTGLVGATGSFLPRLPNGDPRYGFAPDVAPPPSFDVEAVELWSARPVTAVTADLRAGGQADGVLEDDRRLRTIAEARNRPAYVAVDLVAPYLRAVSGLVLLVAVLALCLSVDRAAARGRAGDLVLARIGLGRAGARRLLEVEAAVMVLAGLALGALGWLLSVPLLARLLEPDPSVAPLLRPAAVPGAAVPLLLATAVALLAATLVARAGTRGASEEQVLRAQD